MPHLQMRQKTLSSFSTSTSCLQNDAFHFSENIFFRLFKLQRRIFVAFAALEYFVLNEWDFKNDKLLALNDKLLPSDVEDFYLNIHDVDVIKYFRDAFVGVKKYLLKEKMENLERARFRAKWCVIWFLSKCKLIASFLFSVCMF